MSPVSVLAMRLTVTLAKPAKVRKVLLDFPDRIQFVAFCPDGKTLATSGHASRYHHGGAQRQPEAVPGENKVCTA